MKTLKWECFNCRTFVGEKVRSAYRCQVKGSCPGIDWTNKEKAELLILAKKLIEILEK